MENICQSLSKNLRAYAYLFFILLPQMRAYILILNQDTLTQDERIYYLEQLELCQRKIWR
jgi:hypothetical protein